MNLTKKQALKKIEELKAYIEKKEKKEVWKLKEGEEYYTLNWGGIAYYSWNGDDNDDYLYSIGNCFKTRVEAQQHHEWLKARASLIRRITELNDGWKPNWEENKYCFFYHVNSNKILFIYTTDIDLPSDMYLKSEKLVEQLIDEMEKEIKIYLKV